MDEADYALAWMHQLDKSLPQVYTDYWNAQDLCGFFFAFFSHTQNCLHT